MKIDLDMINIVPRVIKKKKFKIYFMSICSYNFNKIQENHEHLEVILS